MDNKIRVRIAPSPTGPLHLGTARTALFNFLFARKSGGKFLLRLEDTDQSRSTMEFKKNIVEGFKWLGFEFDEAPLYQMERLAKYQEMAQKLVELGFAEKIDSAIVFKAKIALEKLQIDYKPVKAFSKFDKEAKKPKESYYLKNIGKDLIHGPISGTVSNSVLLRSDGIPTFHLAVVVDDEEMKISHVIRGDDHLPNTPLHIILQKALGFEIPIYAHLPMILNIDHTKMSKRGQNVNLSDYRADGYLPKALINFLALLGFSPKGKDQIVSLEQLISEFDFSRVQKSPAVFDREKLDYLNGYYLRKLSANDLDKLLRESFYPKTEKKTLVLSAVLQSRLIKLADAREMSQFFFKEVTVSKDILILKKSDAAKTRQGLRETLKALEKVGETDWENQDQLNQILAEVVKDNQLGNGDVFWPVRAALSGVEQSPSPVELLQILGRDESLARIKKAIEKLN